MYLGILKQQKASHLYLIYHKKTMLWYDASDDMNWLLEMMRLESRKHKWGMFMCKDTHPLFLNVIQSTYSTVDLSD